MTEAEWLIGWCYHRMYDAVRNRATTRQARLYMVACCRLKTAVFFDPRIPRALEAAERCADDPQVEAVANSVWDELVTSPRPRLPQTGPEGELARAITGAWELLDELWSGERYRNERHAIAHAAYLCLRDDPRTVFTGGEANAVELCARAIDSAESLRLGRKREEVEQDGWETESEIQKAIANLLRDIFGNPFRPVTVDPARETSAVVALARSIYEERRFEDLPILADALEEAGCTDADLLGHCRGPGPHTRGCWVVDLLLGKG
ncbi:MAG: hypothetical protein L0Z62_22540 [Gemmataceae bacterium]|nr:hypothetical protein [Gemmataceae bacterium]